MSRNGSLKLSRSISLAAWLVCAGATNAHGQTTAPAKRSADSAHVPSRAPETGQEKSQNQRALESLAALVRDVKYGAWICYPSPARVVEGCTWSEYQDKSNWYGAWANYDLYKFVFPGDGTVQLMVMGAADWQPAVRGTPRGAGLSAIHWECLKTDKKGSVLSSYPCFFRDSSEFSRITLSYETANPKASPNSAYVYWSLRKH